MTINLRATCVVAGLIALATVSAFNVAEANHYILPCRDECDVAGANRWTAIGPDGADVVALAVDPSTPSIAFAGTYGAGVLKTSDAGATWATTNNGLPTLVVLALAVDPATPSTVYAGTDWGVFKSTDGGQSWAAANDGLDGAPQVSVTTLAIDPASPATLYAGTSGGIFKTTNGAQRWASISTRIAGLPGLTPRFIAIDPSSPSTLYLGVEEGYVVKSTDAGTSWATIHIPYDEVDQWPSVEALAIDPHSPSRLYLATGLGLVMSLDGGATWSSSLLPGCGLMAALARGSTCWSPMALPGLTIKALAIDPTSAATVYAGTGDGVVFRTTDGGDHWMPVTDGPLAAGSGVNVMAMAKSAAATVYVGGRVGIFVGSDGTQTWTRPRLGVRTIGVYRLAVDPTATSTIYTTAEGVTKTSDSGDHWTDSSVGIADRRINSLVIDPTWPPTLYAGSSPVFKSIDAGAHWAPVSYGLNRFYSVNAMAIAPSRPSTLYIGVNFKGVLKTTDGGASWTSVNNGLTAIGIYVSRLAVDPTNADIVYVATPPTSLPDTGAKIFKSTDGAAHWRQLSLTLPIISNITSVVIDPVAPSTIYVGYDAYGTRGIGIFKSADSGETWSAPQDLLPATAVWALAIDPSSPSHIYAATSDGVFRSLDGATSWTPFNAGLPVLDVWDLAVDGTGSLLRAATPAGLYEYQLAAPSRTPTAAAGGKMRLPDPGAARE